MHVCGTTLVEKLHECILVVSGELTRPLLGSQGRKKATAEYSRLICYVRKQQSGSYLSLTSSALRGGEERSKVQLGVIWGPLGHQGGYWGEVGHWKMIGI